MRGTDLLALGASLGIIERECRQARIAIDHLIAEENRRIEARGTPCHDPDFAALTHTCAIPDEMVEKIAECGE